MNNQEKLLTVDEVAQYLSVTPMTIYRLIKQKSLQSIKVGQRNIRISQESVKDYLKENNSISEKVEVEEKECNCCGWDDYGYQHEPNCNKKQKNKEENIEQQNNEIHTPETTQEPIVEILENNN